jgi:hypothetical protein
VDTELSDINELGLAASIAPEDLRCGEYVAVLSTTYEYPSFFWCSDGSLTSRHELVRITYTGPEGGVPLKIEAVCLPFVFVRDATGKHRNLDTRMCRLVRLTRGYAQQVWKAMKKVHR